MTICMSCGRRTDPNRSFCTRCGSAVFLDATDPSARRMLSSTTIDTSDDNVEPTGPASSARRVGPAALSKRERLRAQQRARETANVAGLASALWSLIRFGILLYLLYWGYTFVMNTPELRQVIQQVRDTGDIKPALDYLRERFEALAVGEPSSR